MLDALISAGANLLGGFLNRQSQDQFNQAQLGLARDQMALQKEFATHGIQWKVADAQAAGLHPLAALGAQTSSPSPVSAGGEASKFDFSSLGQDLSRAAKAAQTSQARAAVDEEKERKLDIESKGLDNDMKRQTLASRGLSTSRTSGQLGPPIPMPQEGPPRVGGIAVADDDVKSKAVAAPSFRKAMFMGIPWYTSAGSSDAQDLGENRYGEEHPVTKGIGWGIFADDVRHNLYNHFLPWMVDQSELRGRSSPAYRRVRGAARGF